MLIVSIERPCSGRFQLWLNPGVQSRILSDIIATRMRLDELMNNISQSDPADWHCISCWEAGDDAQQIVAVYTPDVAITIAFGLKRSETFEEPWAKRFPDENASSSFVDVLYNGTLVYQDIYVDVDGGRAKLPLPRQRDVLEVPVAKRDFFRLLNTFEPACQFDDYFKRAGLMAVDEPWPDSRRQTSS